MVRFLGIVLLVLLLGGCGETSSSTVTGTVPGPAPFPSAAASALPSPLASPSPGNPASSPSPGPSTAQVTLNLIREANLRAYPGATQLVRLRARNAQNATVFGPLERQPGRFTIELPVTATVLELDYVIGETILGIARIPLSLTGAPVLINDPDFTDVDKLTTLTVTPANVSLPPLATRQLQVTGSFSDGHSYDVTSSVRYSSSSDVASVSDAGLVTADKPGAANVTARLSGITGSARVEVPSANITAITVTPKDILVPTGTALKYQAVADFQDGTHAEVTSRVSWSSSRADVARFDLNQLEVTTLTPGTTQISASLQNVTGSTSLTVTGVAASKLEVFPANKTIRRLNQLGLTVRATYPDGTTKDVTTEAAYASSAPEIAPVSNAGTVFGAFPGTASITARLGDLAATANITVDDSGVPGPLPTPVIPTVRATGRFLARALVVPSGPGAGPVALVRADLNGDGQPDLAAANSLSSNVQVNFNLGSGRFDFGTGLNYPTGSTPMGLAAGDFDKDGDIDLVTTNFNADTITLLFNDGTGVFTSPADVAVRNKPSAVAVADLNGDGNLDLAVANQGPDNISILLGNGAGVFTPDGRPSLPAGAKPQGIVAGNFVGDGRIDLITVNPGGETYSVLRNTGGTGAARFAVSTFATPGTNPRSVAAGDLNRDGLLDLVIAVRGSNQVVPLLNSALGFIPGPGIAGARPNAVAIGDVNNDGFLDVAAALDGGNVLVATGDGSGFFLTTATYAAGRTPNDVVLGDLNGDGKTDAATADTGDDNLSVEQNIGSGVLQPVRVALPAQPRTAVVADFNGDGFNDSAVASAPANVVAILTGAGNGSLTPSAAIPVGLQPLDMVTADFNADGRADLATANRDSDTVSIILNTGGGTFAPAANFPVGNRPRGLCVVDYNGDGRPDLAVANRGSDTVTILNGDGSTAATLTVGPGSNPSCIVSGDFNGDGRADLATLDEGPPGVSVFLNTGGAFTLFTAISLPPSPSWMSTADYTGDGILDLALSFNAIGILAVLPGDGAGNFNFSIAPVFLPVGNPEYVLSLDANGDGLPDMISVCTNCKFLIVALNQGGGTFALFPDYYELPNGPRTIAAGDLNGDRVPDLVLPSENSFLTLVLGLARP